MTTPRARILCVDDEVQVLRGLARQLERRYDLLTATDGAAALRLLEQDPRVDVIISDMRMPGLSGAEFLSQSRALAPEAQRILLTGQTDLASAVAAINQGQIFRFLTKPCPAAELIDTIEAALERRRSSALEHSAVRRNIEQRQLQTDPLTGLASRLGLLAAIEAAAYAATAAVGAVVAYFIAIDGSDEPAAIRDEPWCEELAKVVAQRLREHCACATLIGCWGIDQFVVIETSAGAVDGQLCARGEDLLAMLTAPIPNHEGIVVRASIGIARLTDPLQWQRLIQQAANAALEARHARDVSVCLYRADVPLAIEKQREMVHALREALTREDLQLNYQPIVDTSAGRVRALECLARWQHRTLGHIGPATFIPLAEQSDDIVRLGEWVLWRACHEGKELMEQNPVGVTVNVSARQLNDKGFLPHLQKCLSHSGLPPESLELELTESALAQDLAHLCEVLEQARRLKVRIAVDDFGTGYSSLSYLSRLPIDVIKVDRAFVRDFNEGGRTIISAALAIARDFGLEVIVEGVETAEMLRQVQDLGVSLIQGYWFAKPMPAGLVPEWLHDFARDEALRRGSTRR
jgi:predicted signal transduction protein with EAL and GGDEF domain